MASLLTALGLFTVIPVGTDARISRDEAARAVCWLPLAGLAAVLPAAGVLLAAEAGGHTTVRRLLAATLAVAATGLLSGGLHLDGLADTADGLGSRRPRDEALAIMRRSDVGPFGVAALVVTLLIQITALATIGWGWRAVAALVIAAVTGRVAVVLATGPGSPAARSHGFGALVTTATSTGTRLLTALTLLAGAVAAGAGLGGSPLAVRGAAAVLAGLGGGDLLRRAAIRRLGGMTGDVYGALIEVSTATVLLVLALTS